MDFVYNNNNNTTTTTTNNNNNSNNNNITSMQLNQIQYKDMAKRYLRYTSYKHYQEH